MQIPYQIDSNKQVFYNKCMSSPLHSVPYRLRQVLDSPSEFDLGIRRITPNQL